MHIHCATFDAYHACLTDIFHKHFDFSTFLLSSCFFPYLDPGFFALHLFLQPPRLTEKAGPFIIGRVPSFPYMVFTTKGGKQSIQSTMKDIPNQKLDLSNLQQRSSHLSCIRAKEFGDSRKIYPHGPDFCLFFLFILASLISSHEHQLWLVGDHRLLSAAPRQPSSAFSSSIMDRLCFLWYSKEVGPASERASGNEVCVLMTLELETVALRLSLVLQ